MGGEERGVMAGGGVQTVSPGDAHEVAGHYLRWGREIHTYASRLLGSRDAADDVTQDVFVAALRHGLPDETAAVRPWLYRVATNRCLDVLRRRRRLSWISIAVWREPAGVADPVGDAVARTDAIRQAIAKLPPRDAALLVLVDAQGFGYREVAMMLGMSPSATSAALSRAHARLAGHYADLTKEERP